MSDERQSYPILHALATAVLALVTGAGSTWYMIGDKPHTNGDSHIVFMDDLESYKRATDAELRDYDKRLKKVESKVEVYEEKFAQCGKFHENQEKMYNSMRTDLSIMRQDVTETKTMISLMFDRARDETRGAKK